MVQLFDSHATGGRAPFLIGAQLGLILLALPCAVTPSFTSMFQDVSCCLPMVTELVMNPLYGLLGVMLVLLYVFGLVAPIRPL